MDRVKGRGDGGNVLARLVDGALAAVLLYSFFLPWLSFMGTPVAAHAIRETLRGPHELVSAFSSDSRVSADYSLSLYLWALPAAAALLLLLSLLGRGGARLRSAAGLAAGCVATAAFLIVRKHLEGYPFQRLEHGAWLTLAAGVGLILAAAVRGGMGLRTKR